MIGKMRISNVVAAVLFAALLPMSASATSSLSMVWDNGDGGGFTPTITPTQDSVERASIIAVGDTAGMSGIFVTFEFDDELDIATAGGANGSGVDQIPGCNACTDGGAEQSISLPGMGNDFTAGLPGFGRNQIESTPSVTGRLGSYDVISTSDGLVSATRTLGSVFFVVKASTAADDGNDLDIVILNDTFDAVLASSGADISSTVILNGAQVAPEPGAAGLALAALGSLGFLARRRR